MRPARAGPGVVAAQSDLQWAGGARTSEASQLRAASITVNYNARASQPRWRNERRPGAPRHFSCGNTMRKILPFPSSLSTSMRPPFASTAQRAIERPSPSPPVSLDRPLSTR